MLRPYQEQIVEHIVRHKRCAIWAGMGLGKTYAVQEALGHIPGAYPALVLAPLRVAQSVWPTEATKWGKPPVVPIVGTAEQRRAALQQKADVYAINYENIPWLIETLGGRWPFQTLVADEATRLKSFRLRGGGKRAAMLADMSWKSERFVELTGTPAPNGLQDLWGQIWFLDKGERLGRSYTAFKNRWFREILYNGIPIKLVPMPYAQQQIESRLSDICLSIKAEYWFDLSEPIRNIIMVTLQPKAQKIYTTMERQLFAEIGGGAINAASAAARTIKCLQLANGAVYDDQGGVHWLHDAKLDALRSIIEEAAGAPVLVAYQFRHDLDRLRAAFPQAEVLRRSPAVIARWNAGEIPILLAHPGACGHGLNLQDGGNILVFFGLWWNLEEHQQIIERIGPTRQAQSGYQRPVYIHYIVAAGTLDEVVLDALRNKKHVQQALLDALQARKEA